MDINIQIWNKAQKNLKNTIYQNFYIHLSGLNFFILDIKIQNMDNIPNTLIIK